MCDGVQITMNSDSRLKNISGNFTDGLNKIKLIKTYKLYIKIRQRKDSSCRCDCTRTTKNLSKCCLKKGSDGYLTVRQEDMFYAMLNAIKELEKKNKKLEARLLKLEQRK